MQAGDVIVEAGGVPIEFSRTARNLLRAIIAARAVDQPIDFTVERDGRRLSFSVAPAAMTDETGATAYMIGIVFPAAPPSARRSD